MAHFCGEPRVSGHDSLIEWKELRTGRSARLDSELTMHGTSVAGAQEGRGGPGDAQRVGRDECLREPAPDDRPASVTHLLPPALTPRPFGRWVPSEKHAARWMLLHQVAEIASLKPHWLAVGRVLVPVGRPPMIDLPSYSPTAAGLCVRGLAAP